MSLVSFYVIGYSVFLSDYKDITFLPTLKINNDFFYKLQTATQFNHAK